jgi:hypothetical protein|tara:strand:- start:182 stop:382 length:201 start_codon:yes stop_codon:yes gene_type:complete
MDFHMQAEKTVPGKKESAAETGQAMVEYALASAFCIFSLLAILGVYLSVIVTYYDRLLSYFSTPLP